MKNENKILIRVALFLAVFLVELYLYLFVRKTTLDLIITIAAGVLVIVSLIFYFRAAGKSNQR